MTILTFYSFTRVEWLDSNYYNHCIIQSVCITKDIHRKTLNSQFLTHLYRATGESIRNEHTKTKRIQSKLQSNQSVRVDLERERRKTANVSPRASQYHNQSTADRPMSSMSFQSSRTSIRSFQLGFYTTVLQFFL